MHLISPLIRQLLGQFLDRYRLFRDSRLHWCDAPALADGFIWLPVPQIDRVSLFNSGTSRIAWPIRLYRYGLDAQAK